MTLVYFLIVIGILVFVHEFGHFIMAKRAGVRVEKFSLGMGPKLFGYKKGDTDYIISALPLGGYVKMAGENPDEEATGAPDEFPSKTVWQRAKIAAAGSLTNIAVAFLLMPIVFMVGTYAEGPAKVGFVEKGSPAEKAGFQAGDVIEEINGRRISDWTKALTLIAVNPDTDVAVTLDRSGEKKKLSLRVTSWASPNMKVNDKDGNPIEIAAVVVWRVQDTAQAMFDVDDYLKVRYAVQIEGLSKRAAARRFGIDPRTVDKMMRFSVPWTSPDSVESQSLFLLAGSERCFECCRTDVTEARVPPARVIEAFNVLANGRAGLVSGREGNAPDQFRFDGLEHGLDHRVIVAVAAPAHRRDEAVIAQHAPVVFRAILTAAIRVMDQAGRRSTQYDRTPQGVHCQASFHPITQVPADDLP